MIVGACARRLGSRAGPRTGKEERGFLAHGSKKVPCQFQASQCRGGSRKKYILERPLYRSRRQAGPPTASVCSTSRRWGAGGGGGGSVTKSGTGERVELGGRRPDPGAGSRGEFSFFNLFWNGEACLRAWNNCHFYFYSILRIKISVFHMFFRELPPIRFLSGNIWCDLFVSPRKCCAHQAKVKQG